MPHAKEQDKVKIHYTGKLPDGTVFDSSQGKEPLEFTIGDRTIIPGLEEAVVGMSPGEQKTEAVAAEMAFGPFRNELVQELTRSEFPTESPPVVGQRYNAQSAGQASIVLTVIDVSGETVTVDANHPLAGKDLVFDIELVEIL
jgi:peptidylprolyl isomerase